MNKKLFNIKTWLWAAVFALFAIFSYIGFAGQPEEFPPYVSHSPSPTGTKAIFTYLENEYEAVERWSNEPELLPGGGAGQLLIMVEPRFTPDQEEMDAYREYIESGNTVLLFMENPVGMFDIRAEYGAEPLEQPVELERNDGNEFSAALGSPVRIQTLDEDEILLSDDFGAAAVRRPAGDGELIISLSSGWLVNGNLLDNDNIPLALFLISQGNQEGIILFDEYLHGDGPAVTAVYPMAFLVFLLQGAIVALLWLWSKGKRFGPVFEPREESVRYSDESIRALAAWYLRLKGGRFNESLQIQADYLRMLMQHHWRIPGKYSWKETEDQLKLKWQGKSETEIAAFVLGLEEVLYKEKVSRQEYLHWSRKLDSLKKEVEKE
ncbi:DUF4350 domain-containing protein [Evansella clarkii]|uniref:DUF4350 domain-containing protein n=1 Tax=Evansella clarkii TaxID=79879 RepID=UPI001474A44C|nr:DUF4350 domain-containing protein [Evansella clarkii]